MILIEKKKLALTWKEFEYQQYHKIYFQLDNTKMRKIIHWT